jgi:hypothetical protein
MSTLSKDTHPDAEKFQIELIRKADFTKKMSLLVSMTETMRLLSFRAIKRANPELNDRECDLLFVEYHYGKDLADKLKKYLKNK